DQGHGFFVQGQTLLRVGVGAGVVKECVDSLVGIGTAVGAYGALLVSVQERVEAVVGVAGDGAPAKEADGDVVLTGNCVDLVQIGGQFEGLDGGIDAHFGEYALDGCRALDVLQVTAGR